MSLLLATETTQLRVQRQKLLLGPPRSQGLAFFHYKHKTYLPRPFITITTSAANRQDVIVYYDLGYFSSAFYWKSTTSAANRQDAENLFGIGFLLLSTTYVFLFLPNPKSYGFYNNPNIGCEPARWNSLLHRNAGSTSMCTQPSWAKTLLARTSKLSFAKISHL